MTLNDNGSCQLWYHSVHRAPEGRVAKRRVTFMLGCYLLLLKPVANSVTFWAIIDFQKYPKFEGRLYKNHYLLLKEVLSKLLPGPLNVFYSNRVLH